VIRFKCPSCRKVLQVDDSKAGKKARCVCQTVIRVPSSAGAPAASRAPAAAQGTSATPAAEMKAACPSCGRSLRMPSGVRQGQNIKCPCGQVFQYQPGGGVAPQAARQAPTPTDDTSWLDDLPTGPPSGSAPQPVTQFRQTAMPAANSTAKPMNPQLAAAQAELQGNETRQLESADDNGAFATESSILNGSTIGGVLAMVIAVVWFVGGLMAGIIFFYPPVLFIIGLVGFVRGLLGK
jgi:hypothetical protein